MIVRAELEREDHVGAALGLMGRFVHDGVRPEDVTWTTPADTTDLFGPFMGETIVASGQRPSAPEGLPAVFRTLAEDALLHEDCTRFQVMHRLLDRMARMPRLIENPVDADVRKAFQLAKAVRHDKHKMKAFVRFREMQDENNRERFVAWFEPTHHIVRAVAPFFAKRFASMRWSILTPRQNAHWNGASLTFDRGEVEGELPRRDRLEAAWRTYYRSIFNPARLKVKAMSTEMPKKYWHNLPESPLILPLIREADRQMRSMIQSKPTVTIRRVPSLARYVRAEASALGQMPTAPQSLMELSAALASCRRCPLHSCATQVVLGVGPIAPALMIVGAQPCDQEDLSGQVFDGRAGDLLLVALKRTGIDRSCCYVTQAVKHFKFEPRGRHREANPPSAAERQECRVWLDHERRIVHPKAIVALGIVAAQAVLDHKSHPSDERDQVLTTSDGTRVIIAPDPAELLRLSNPIDKKEGWQQFLAAFSRAARLVSLADAKRDTPNMVE